MIRQVVLALAILLVSWSPVQAADVAGWKITCPSSLSFTSTESKTLSCTTTAPAGHSYPLYDYQYLFKQGQSYSYRQQGTKIADGTSYPRTYTVFGSNVANGDKLEVRAYEGSSKLLATSNPIAVSKGSAIVPGTITVTVDIKETDEQWSSLCPAENRYCADGVKEVRLHWKVTSGTVTANDSAAIAILGAQDGTRERSTGPSYSPNPYETTLYWPVDPDWKGQKLVGRWLRWNPATSHYDKLFESPSITVSQ